MKEGVRSEIRFLLNGQPVALAEVPASQTLLDFLRIGKGLRGSKEGCAEGDCGACTVLVGRLDNGELIYESVNACIRFTASLDGCHVVTIEHLVGKDGTQHPVQQAMVDFHGSQCGFCTPGIVMSVYALWMRKPRPGRSEIEEALQGNLCRCTGYAPIVRAAEAASDYGDVADDPLVKERETVIAKLTDLHDGRRVETGPGHDRVIIPACVDDLAEVLEGHPKATIVAGATDVGLWVTKFMREIAPAVFIGNIKGLRKAEVTSEGVRFWAGVSYTDALPLIEAHFPALAAFWSRIGGTQVRNMGTIGGNIANGSPIGDTPPPLMVLGASVVLRKGAARRIVKLENFFIDYGKQDRQPGEFVESVFVPFLPADEHFAVYKVSKRRDEDISALCGAFRIKIEGEAIKSATIAFGGMAAVPKRATNVEAALVGKTWTEATVEMAVAAFAEDFQPITDMRASADYRMLAAQNLLRRFFLEKSGVAETLSRGAA